MVDSSKSGRRYAGHEHIALIGGGDAGGKARGLLRMAALLGSDFPADAFPEFPVGVPAMTILTTEVFDAFMERNGLQAVAFSDQPDIRIAHAFQKGNLPVEVLGDLRALVKRMRSPLAVRSSSLLEDARYRPFAGVYGTKMIPNHQPDIDTRFRKLSEAIKFVYASTYFAPAKAYAAATGVSPADEKMAVIIQEIVGHRSHDRFYPELSGVVRSYNFYATGRTRPEEGVITLALGLGKTVVDGGQAWTYSPPYPRIDPPFSSIGDLLKFSQTEFWAVNMGKPPAYDPINETEYLVKAGLAEAEADNSLRYLASTYDDSSHRIVMGTAMPGPRVVTFAPLLKLNALPLNDVILSLLRLSEEALETPVEIEFAATFSADTHALPGTNSAGRGNRFGFLQVRPMVISHREVSVNPGEMIGPQTFVATRQALGNGVNKGIADIVFVKPDVFESRHTPQIAREIERMNNQLMTANCPYALIGFGRWGSSSSWLGIPVSWPQVSGARAIVEAMLPGMQVELSQGSHFFHNLSSLGVTYFSVQDARMGRIDWKWLMQQPAAGEMTFIRHVRLSHPLIIKVDGRSRRGVVMKAENS